jgi:hypothetical protein
MPVSLALRAAGDLVHMAVRSGLLSREFVLSLLGPHVPSGARRYVSRKATIAILNQRKAADGSVRPWEALGVSERR